MTDQRIPVFRDLFVVAIDFGTTFCSIFYSLDGCATRAVRLDGQEQRIPTAILIDDTGKILAFGGKAGIQYENKHGEDISRHYYFHHIKMLLERDKVSQVYIFHINVLNISTFLGDFFVVRLFSECIAIYHYTNLTLYFVCESVTDVIAGGHRKPFDPS